MRRALQRFEENGHQIVSKLSLRGVKRKPIVSELFEEALLRPTLLKKWAPFSLIERCRIIQDKYDVKVSPMRLWSFYRRNKITYRRAYKSY